MSAKEILLIGSRETNGSEIVRESIQTAFTLHGTKMRKNKKDLFIIHPVRVAAIVTECTKNPRIVASAFLHDTVEDTDYTIEMLKNEFGASVASIVEALTESDKDASWEDRKRQTVKSMKKASQPALLVKGSDLIDNVLSLKEEYDEEGPEFWNKFGASPERKLEHYRTICTIIKSRCENRRIVEKLRNLEGVIDYLEMSLKEAA